MDCKRVQSAVNLANETRRICARSLDANNNSVESGIDPPFANKKMNTSSKKHAREVFQVKNLRSLSEEEIERIHETVRGDMAMNDQIISAEIKEIINSYNSAVNNELDLRQCNNKIKHAKEDLESLLEDISKLKIL